MVLRWEIDVAVPHKNISNASNKHLSSRSPEHSMHFSLLPTPFSLVSQSLSVGRKVGGIPRGESRARHGRLRSWAVDTAYQPPSRHHASAPQGRECLAGWWCNWYKSKKKGKSQRRQRKTGLLGEKIPKFSYHCRFITPRQQRPKAVLG